MWLTAARTTFRKTGTGTVRRTGLHRYSGTGQGMWNLNGLRWCYTATEITVRSTSVLANCSAISLKIEQIMKRELVREDIQQTIRIMLTTNYLSCLHEEVAYETLYSFDMGRHRYEALGLVDNTDTVSSLSCVYLQN